MSETTALPLTLEEYRQTFGLAFSDPDRYPDQLVLAYLSLAAILLNPNLWCDQLKFGIAQFTNHNLALDAQGVRVAMTGGIPGSPAFPVASKSVGPVSVSYDATSGIEADAGHWNLTVYGRRFYHLMMLIGMGGGQLGGSPFPAAIWPGSAWWFFYGWIPGP